MAAPRQPNDGMREEIVLDERNRPTGLVIPVTQLEYAHREEGRGMMAFSGPEDPVYGSYLAKLPLDELKFALAKHDSAKALAFLADLADPGKSKTDICTLAKQNKIGLPEMMQIWRSHNLVGAMNVFIEGSPVIAEHTVEDAKSRRTCCPRCDGGGVIRVTRRDQVEWIDCPTCETRGWVRKPGEHKSRQQIFQAVGIIASTPAISIVNQIQQNTGVESVIDELERTTVEVEAGEP